MTSREIIIELIDKKLINGEQAFVLINDIIKGELMEAWDTLQKCSKEYNKPGELTWINPLVSANTYSTTATSGSSK